MTSDVLAWAPRWEAGVDSPICSAGLRLTGAPQASWEAACRWLHQHDQLTPLQLALYAQTHEPAVIVMAVRGDPLAAPNAPVTLFNRALQAGLAQCLAEVEA